MALATVGDVAVRLGRALSMTEQARSDPGLIEEASALVLAYLNLDEEPVPIAPALTIPAALTIVTSRMVARVLDQDAAAITPVGSESVTQTMGPFSESYKFGSDSTSRAPWLTSGDKVLLKRYRVNGGVTSVPMGTEQTGLYLRVVR